MDGGITGGNLIESKVNRNFHILKSANPGPSLPILAPLALYYPYPRPPSRVNISPFGRTLTLVDLWEKSREIVTRYTPFNLLFRLVVAPLLLVKFHILSV